MMVKLRQLVNPPILNDGRVGFQGDSEYIREDGEVRMGSWAFLDAMYIDDAHEGNYFTLDYEIDDSILVGETRWEVENDNGVLCTVQLIYGDDNVSLSEVSSLIKYMLELNLCFDELKSQYMVLAHELMATINCNSCNTCDNAINSEERIKRLVSNLYDDNEELMNEFDALKDIIDLVDGKLENLKDG